MIQSSYSTHEPHGYNQVATYLTVMTLERLVAKLQIFHHLIGQEHKIHFHFCIVRHTSQGHLSSLV